MNITIGSGLNRFEFTAHWGYLWFRVPGIGQGIYHRETGFVFDRWAVVKGAKIA